MNGSRWFSRYQDGIEHGRERTDRGGDIVTFRTGREDSLRLRLFEKIMQEFKARLQLCGCIAALIHGSGRESFQRCQKVCALHSYSLMRESEAKHPCDDYPHKAAATNRLR